MRRRRRRRRRRGTTQGKTSTTSSLTVSSKKALLSPPNSLLFPRILDLLKKLCLNPAQICPSSGRWESNVEGSVSVSLLANGAPIVANVDLAATAGLLMSQNPPHPSPNPQPALPKQELIRASHGCRWYSLDPQWQPGEPLHSGLGRQPCKR